MRGSIRMALAGILAASCSGFAETRADRFFGPYSCRRGIVYKTVGDEALDMALVWPDPRPEGPMPVVLYTHGGGWGKGDKTKMFGPACKGTLDRLLGHGIACAAIEYRLTRRGMSTAYDCVVDCKDAARFLVKHGEELGLDADRMATWGGSAGGHLCLMTALAPDERFPGDEALAGIVPRFRCVASLYPATTFLVPEVLVGSNFERPGRFVPFLGGPFEEHRELAALLSPAEHLGPDSPPVMVLHGDKDQVLSFRNATYLAEVARGRQADVQVVRVRNALHGFAGTDLDPPREEVVRLAADFLIRHLTRP